jgi:hypothetical protein
MRSIIEDNDLEVMATIARYSASYAKIAKPAWWMKSKDCGPVVRLYELPLSTRIRQT